MTSCKPKPMPEASALPTGGPASSSWALTIKQLSVAGATRVERPRAINPRPAGVIRNGSATHAVLACFQARPETFLTMAALQSQCAHSEKAINWALLFLRTQGLISAQRDAARNERYLRYRLNQEVANRYARVSLPASARGRPPGHDMAVEESLRRCATCNHLSSANTCIDATKSGVPLPKVDAPRRCVAYVPKWEEQDQRTGLQLWPELVVSRNAGGGQAEPVLDSTAHQSKGDFK